MGAGITGIKKSRYKITVTGFNFFRNQYALTFGVFQVPDFLNGFSQG